MEIPRHNGKAIRKTRKPDRISDLRLLSAMKVEYGLRPDSPIPDESYPASRFSGVTPADTPVLN
jgi:hypothetical protein